MLFISALDKIKNLLCVRLGFSYFALNFMFEVIFDCGEYGNYYLSTQEALLYNSSDSQQSNLEIWEQ